MRRLFVCILLGWSLGALAADPAPAKPKAAPAPAAELPKAVAIKLEPFVLIPEPRSMRSAISKVLGNARQTVFSPMRETLEAPGLRPYTEAEFTKLGIGWETFVEKARATADRRLATLQPDFIKDAAGHVRYAVYRGEQQWFAGLMLAPSLLKVFEPIFGKEIWLAAPDRNALYVFPPNASLVDDFSGDLEERFNANPFSASEEIFVLKADDETPQAVGTFTAR